MGPIFVKRKQRKLNFIIAAALVVGLGYFAWDKFGSGVPGDGAPAREDAGQVFNDLAERYVKLVLASPRASS